MNQEYKNNTEQRDRNNPTSTSSLFEKGRESLTRKEFITTAGRFILLALLAFLVTFLITGRKTTPEEEVCTNDHRCGGCSKRDNCKIRER
jgi:hypothetical protein